MSLAMSASPRTTRKNRAVRIASEMSASVDALLTSAATPSTSMKLFTGVGPVYSGSTFVPNTDNWLQSLRSQLTGIHMGAGAWTQSYGLIPLGDRFLLSCGHNGPRLGDTLKYVKADGTVFTTTISKWINDHEDILQIYVSDTKQAYVTDLSLYVTADVLPAWVYRAPIIRITDEDRAAMDSIDPPTVAISQGNWTDGPTSPYGKADTPDNRMVFVKSMLLKTPRTGLRDPFHHGAYVGDSGTPEYVLLGGVLYLYRVITTGGETGIYVADWLDYLNALIVRGATAASISPITVSTTTPQI